MLWTADSPDAEGAVLFDPNELSERGHHGALGRSRSPTAASSSRCALSDAGSDWRTLAGPPRGDRRGAARPDRVEQVLVRAPGRTDDAGFFYGRYPEPPADAAYDAPNLDMELRYHRLGTDPARTTRWSSRSRPSRSGASSPRSPTTAASSSSRSGGAPTPRAGSTSPTWRTASSRRVVRPRARRGRRPLRARRDDRPARSTSLTDRDAPLGRVIAVDVDDPAQVARGHPGGRRGAGARRPRRRSAGRASYLHDAHAPARDLRARRPVTSSTSPARDRLDRRAWPVAARTTSCS